MLHRIFIIIWAVFIPFFSYANNYIIDSAEHYPEAHVELWYNLYDNDKEYLLLNIQLEKNWKTYWRSPGYAGLPPNITSNNTTITIHDILYPLPKRDIILGESNFVYDNNILLPIVITRTKNTPQLIDITVKLLICDDICIPAIFNFNHTVTTIKPDYNAQHYAFLKAKNVIPPFISDVSILGDISYDDTTISWHIDTNYIKNFPLNVIIEHRDGTTQYSQEHHPNFVTHITSIESCARVTLFNDDISASFLCDNISYKAPSLLYIYGTMILLALLGGLILNIMPCILPALSLKIIALSKLRDNDAAPRAYKKSILAFISGIMAFFIMLAFIIIGIKKLGFYIGWGTQFQSPLFLWFIIGLMLYFARWFWWDSYQKNIPLFFRRYLQNIPYLNQDFALGFTTSLLSTPCSAPFLGTAVAFALNGQVYDIIIIFTMLGFGLSSPWWVILCMPKSISYIPKPGPWMLVVQKIGALLLLCTALYFTYILYISLHYAAIIIAILWVIWLGIDYVKYTNNKIFIIKYSVKILIIILSLYIIYSTPSYTTTHDDDTPLWVDYSPAIVAKYQAEQRNIFIDVTADWCITCNINKLYVLTSHVFNDWAARHDVILIRADWTKPNKDIELLLQKYNRYGIPFNLYLEYDKNQYKQVIYSEILTRDEFQ